MPNTKKKATHKKVKKVKAWAGIENKNIGTGWIENEGFEDTTHGIFKTRREARTHYELVVPCTITYQLPSPTSKGRRTGKK